MKKITLLIFALIVGGLAFAQPANDTCATAEVLTMDGIISASTTTATQTDSSTCGTSHTSAPEVWYTFTDMSGAGSMVTIDTCGAGSNYDTKLQAWSGSCGALVCETGNDDFCGLQSQISFMTDGSSTYYIKVFGFSSGSGNFDLNVVGLPQPATGYVCSDIPAANINFTTSCGPGDLYRSNTDQLDINWTDATVGPFGYATIEFGVGVNCFPGNTYNVFLNGFSQGTITPTNNCACGETPELFTINLNPADYIQGGANTFTIDIINSFGLRDLGTDVYAIVCAGPSAPPIISCPADIMIDTTTGLCSGVANWADPIAIDPEDGPLATTQTMGPASGSVLPTGVTLIEYSATDSDGITSTCQFTVTVTDNEDPIAACQNIAVDLDVNGMATITPADIDAGSSDNCGIVSYELGILGPPTTGSLTTTFASNNSFSGNMFEVMPLNDITVDSFDVNNGGGTLDYEVYMKTGSYLGSETTAGDWMLVGTALGVAGAGTDNPTPLGLAMDVDLTAGNMVSFYVACTNNTSHNYVNGTTEGALWASDANLEIYEGVGKGGPVVFTGSTFRPRNFSGNIVYSTPAGIVPFSGDFDCSMVGPNDITLTVTDAEGNSTTCTSTVTVSDVTAPELVCNGQPNNVNELQDFEGAAIPSGWTSIIDAGAQDWTFGSGDLPTGDDFPTFAAIFDDDAAGSGNTNAGSLVSPVYDLSGATGSTVMLGYEVAFQEAGDQEFSVEVYDGAIWNQIAFYDADLDPDIQTEAFDVSAFANAAFQVRFVYDDLGGWGWHAAIDNFTLQYDVPATPYDVILDANGNATINVADLLLSVNEACGWIATVGGAPAPSTLFTTLDGGNGNFGNMFDMNALEDVTIDSFDIHGDVGAVFDVEVYAKAGTYVGFETDAAAWTLIGTAPGVVSNGDGVVTPLNLALNYAMASGETHAFYVTPTDFTSGGFNYTNGTVVGAVFAADANLEFLEGAGSGYPFDGTLFSPRVFNGNIQYSLGGGPSTTLDVDCSNLGENLIEVTVTDDSGNVGTCMATFNVIDDTDPILICMDVTIELGADGTAVVDPMALLATIPSTYNVITISSDNQSGTPGETDITVPVTAADNISFDWDYSTPDGPAFDSFGYLLNGVYTELTDPAGATNQNGSAGPIAVAPGDVFGFRSASVDGTFGACTTVVSNFMPGFTGQFDPANWTETLNNSDGSATFVEIPGGPLSFDACGITILAVDVTEVTCADIGTPIVVTVFASDASGNIAACTSTVTVVDVLAPEVTCPADITVDPGVGNLFYEVPDYFGTGEATALDNCTDPLTIFSQDPAVGALLPDGVYTVTMTAEDEYGNIGTCTFELTVESVLGLDDNELDIAISMYPNPAETQVTITNSSNIQLEKAAIYDMNGKLIQQVDLSNMTGEKVIDVSYLSAGVYMVQITSDDSSAIKRLIKE